MAQLQLVAMEALSAFAPGTRTLLTNGMKRASQLEVLAVKILPVYEKVALVSSTSLIYEILLVTKSAQCAASSKLANLEPRNPRGYLS